MATNNSKALSIAETAVSNRVPLTLRDFFFQDPFFQAAWEDFDRIRQDMIKESQDFWAKVRQDMGDAHQALSTETKKDAVLTSESLDAFDSPLTPMIFPRRWMLPRFLSRDESEKIFPSDFFDFDRKQNQDLRVKDDDAKFEVSLDTHEYRPDEIKVNVIGNLLHVEAKHEEKSENKFVSRQFSRKYTLPKGCEATTVASNLSSDGILMITAPKKPAIQSDGPRMVPIEKK